MKRRNILKAVGAGATIGLAGCTGDNDNSTDSGDGGDGGGDGGDGSAGDTPENTPTTAYEERMEVNPSQLAFQKAKCGTEKLEYIVDTVYDDASFVIKMGGHYKTNQKCVNTKFLPPRYDSDAGNVTLRIGAGEEFEDGCKSECEDGSPMMRFAERVEVIFRDTDPDDITTDTFSVVFEYPDGSTPTMVEGIPLKEDESNL